MAAATEGGRPLPPLPFLLAKVSPAPHLHFHWSAFADLSTDRQLGWSVGPIPWTAIDRFAARHRIDDPDEFERFVHMMRVMDRVFLDWCAEKSR